MAMIEKEGQENSVIDGEIESVEVNHPAKEVDAEVQLEESTAEEEPVAGEETTDKLGINDLSEVGEETLEDEEPKIPAPQVVYQTQVSNEQYSVIGASLLGRSHLREEMPCQDYHLFEDLGSGWQVYIVSDGAGSAKESHRGSKTTCTLLMRSVKRILEKTNWQADGALPSEMDWNIEFQNLCRGVKGLMEEQVESLDEPVQPKDFNATLMLLIVAPEGMLVGHIGDGRMGYQDMNGNWHSLITPHKGEEANMTVFLMNKWDVPRMPALKMSGVYVPETRKVNERPQKVVIMTDGCENFSWLCVGLDADLGIYRDRNQPFAGFLNPLFDCMRDTEDKDKVEVFASFINAANGLCVSEQDDRTMIIGDYGLQRKECPDTAEGQDDSPSQD